MANSSFGRAFASARKSGKATFVWQGKRYTTKLKSETKKAPASKAPPAKKPKKGSSELFGGKVRVKTAAGDASRSKKAAARKSADSTYVPSPAKNPVRTAKAPASPTAKPAGKTRTAKAAPSPTKKPKKGSSELFGGKFRIRTAAGDASRSKAAEKRRVADRTYVPAPGGKPQKPVTASMLSIPKVKMADGKPTQATKKRKERRKTKPRGLLSYLGFGD